MVFSALVYNQLDRLNNIKLNGSANSTVIFNYNQVPRRTSMVPIDTFTSAVFLLYLAQQSVLVMDQLGDGLLRF